ncbi:MAG: hypothetical protein LBP63_00540 [Prevotellaceae bacterium]|jgi:hypothetical protein|nr:hypothetical protein [Prevotellaceae bacterium]
MAGTGIIIERDSNGAASFARIDLKKYGKTLAPFFKKAGVDIEDIPYNNEFVDKIRRAEKQKSKKIDLQKYGISI